MKAELQQIRDALRESLATIRLSYGPVRDRISIALAALDKLEAQPEQQPTDVPHVHTVYDAVGGGYVCSGCGMRFAAPVATPTDVPVVTHLNMDPNASQETKDAVKEVIQAAYNHKPAAKVLTR